MINRDELQAMTVKQLRDYASTEGIRFNTRVRKPEMIERLAELADKGQVETTTVKGEKATGTATKLTVVYGGSGPEVHKSDCGDLKKLTEAKGFGQETVEVSSHTELTHFIYSDMIDSGESTLEDNYMAYNVKPCCPALGSKAETVEQAREEASKEEAEATSGISENGNKIIRKATLDTYSPEDLRGMAKPRLADIARSRAGKGQYSRMNKAQLIEVIQANPVYTRYAADATEEELEAMGKLAVKASKEARKAKEDKVKAPKGAKAEKFLPAAPEPKMLPLKEKAAAPAKAEEEPKKETSTKSDEKAALFMKNIADDWTTEVSSREGEKTEVTATRGDESIKIHWLQGVFHNGNGIYTDPLGRTIVMRNASACLKQAEVSEEVALQKAQAKQAGKRTRKGSGMGRPKNAPQAEEVPQEQLPFDPEESTAKEIITAVEGKKITWVNTVSGKVQSATVKPSKANKILPGTAKSPSPIIQFMTEAGECAVRISSIKSVK